MSVLTIETGDQLGPLAVEVFPPEGDSLQFALSAGAPSRRLENLAPGQYAVLGRRPNGERLQRVAQVKPGEERTVRLVDRVEVTPNSLMRSEVLRGQTGQPKLREAESTFWEELRGLSALLPRPFGSFFSFVSRRRSSDEHKLSLRFWSGDEQTFLPDVLSSVVVSSEFLKVRITTSRSRDLPLLSVGLINEQGIGPIITIPPFWEGLEISFIATGIASGVASRSANPGGRRTPVALTSPLEPAVADLLTNLAAPIPSEPDSVWNQSAAALAELTPDWARALVAAKFKSPAEAILAAHYFLRFSPGDLPLDWAENLARAYPMVADGPAIAAAAWRAGATDAQPASPDEIDSKVELFVRMALSRPSCLFARSRSLLVELMQLAGVKAEGGRWTGFLEFGADAGGLDCFWGASPSQPGRDGAKSSSPLPAIVLLVNEQFISRTNS